MADLQLISALEDQTACLKNIARDMQSIKSDLVRVLNYIHEAESEVPEKVRRFITYFHDIHDVKYIYEESGHAVPPYILREIERCDDRFRHIAEDLTRSGGAFEKIRREMTKREGNRWDHSAMLPKQEKTDETGSSES